MIKAFFKRVPASDQLILPFSWFFPWDNAPEHIAAVVCAKFHRRQEHPAVRPVHQISLQKTYICSRK